MTEPPPLSPLLIELLNPDPIQRLVLQRDEFKLAIKGFTLVEQDLIGYVNEAFVEKLEGGLGGFRRVLSMAVALGIIPVKFKPLLVELADLRNGFAHGSIESLTPARRDKLLDTLAPIMPENPGKAAAFAALGADHPAVTLGAALAAARAIVTVGGDLARERRNAVSPDTLRDGLVKYLGEERAKRADKHQAE